jgi:hypothetical protein
MINANPEESESLDGEKLNTWRVEREEQVPFKR